MSCWRFVMGMRCFVWKMWIAGRGGCWRRLLLEGSGGGERFDEGWGDCEGAGVSGVELQGDGAGGGGVREVRGLGDETGASVEPEGEGRVGAGEEVFAIGIGGLAGERGEGRPGDDAGSAAVGGVGDAECGLRGQEALPVDGV